MSTSPFTGDIDLPVVPIRDTLAIFALVGLGIGLTGGVVLSQLGGGNALLGPILTLLVVSIALVLGPVVGLITGLRTAEHWGNPRGAYLGGLLGAVVGYLLMMGIVLAVLLAVLAAGASSGAEGSGLVEGSAGGDFGLGQYLVPVLVVAIPTGLTGLGGAVVGHREPSVGRGRSLDVDPRVVGVGAVVVLVAVAGVLVVPALTAPGPEALEVTGDVSLAATEVFAGGTVANPTDSAIDAELALEFRVDGELVTSTTEPISVPAGGETSLEVSLATVEDLSSEQIQAINQGSYEIRYGLANETVATFSPEA